MGSGDGSGRLGPQIGAVGDDVLKVLNNGGRTNAEVSGLLEEGGSVQEVAASEVLQSEDVPVSEITVVPAATGPIQAGEITTFQDFVDRSVVGDGIEGHELWQHANLRANGLATTRLSTEASQGNPVIALDRSVHQQVNAAQRLFDASVQTPLENINANAQILRDLKVAPEADITRLQQMAIEHAQKYGY